MASFFNAVTVAVTLIAIFAAVANSGNVLVLEALSSPSHKNIFSPFVNGLAKNGHQVTVVSSLKPKETTKNVRELVVLPGFDYFPNISTMRIRKEGIIGMLSQGSGHILEACHTVYRHPEFQELLKQSFDVVIIDAIGNDCFYGVVHKLQSPLIMVSTFPAPSYFTDNLGNRLPSSFVPDAMLPFVSPLTFFQRLLNFALSPFWPVLWELNVKGSDGVYREHLGQDYPSPDEIKGNVSLLLVNAHFSIDGARPTLPDVVEIGGGHCKPGKPLPKDIEEFVSKGDNGFIFFSLGSIVKPHELTDEIRNVFLNAFRKLKYQVIWKWNAETMPGLPDNVKLLKWAPQQDILAHPKIKLFMSHSGLLSIQEAVYHAVPVLGIPIFGDQNVNAQKAAIMGFGEAIEILTVTEEELESTIKKILDNNKYKERVQELSTVFRDRNTDPVEDAVYWIEYVMRHKGATHLRAASRQLNFFQYHCLDVAAFLLAIALLVLWLLKSCTLKLVRKCCGKSVPESSKKNN